jgi:preprotein translocase subunit SecA
MTYQRFLGRYLLLCGMTGTAQEVTPELRRVYDLEVLRIPTHLPTGRIRLPDRCWASAEARWEAVAARAAALSRSGSAVLVGTRSVEASEELGRRLERLGVAHAVLNARNDKEEADIVAQAGQAGRITIATNMAGRGTDIKPSAEVIAKGGLHVILTEFHESSRVDRQLFGRSARQGQPGIVQAMVSLEDDLFQRYVSSLAAGAKTFADSKGITPRWLVRLLVIYAQAAAEWRNARIRMSTLKQDRKQQKLLGFSAKSH